jgi:hypothetical protein
MYIQLLHFESWRLDGGYCSAQKKSEEIKE